MPDGQTIAPGLNATYDQGYNACLNDLLDWWDDKPSVTAQEMLDYIKDVRRPEPKSELS